MPAGLPIAIALLVQAATPVPAPAATPGTTETDQPADTDTADTAAADTAADDSGQSCRTATPSADATEIVVCAERPKGYRIDPDVRTAKRHARSRPQRRSNEHMKDMNCASVGPAGCIAAPGINLVGAALTAVEMASKALRGENVGEMFVTTPQASEYELYVAAKRRREAAEAEEAAALKAKAAAAAAATPAGPAAPAIPVP
jgi:hypothetical protein